MATAKKKAKKILVLKSGAEFEVLSDKGKYYVCEGAQFRKSNPAVDRVETRKEAKTEEVEAEETEAETHAD